MIGEIAILNVGEGDTKLTFDPENEAETQRAARIVSDMIRRGYAIFIEVGHDDQDRPLYRRAEGFDEKTCEYIIAFDPPDEQESSAHEEAEAVASPQETRTRRPTQARGRGKKCKRLPASNARAVGVHRTAGG